MVLPGSPLEHFSAPRQVRLRHPWQVQQSVQVVFVCGRSRMTPQKRLLRIYHAAQHRP